MKRSVLWVLGGVCVTLIVLGIAWKWTEPLSMENTPAPIVKEEPIEQSTVTNDVGTFTLTRTIEEREGYRRETGIATNMATGEKITIGTLIQQGDEVVLTRGDAALAATFNRVVEGSSASSVAFTDDSDMQITLSGSWDAPRITLDILETFAQEKAIVFTLPMQESLSLYQYDPQAKERLSLIRELP